MLLWQRKTPDRWHQARVKALKGAFALYAFLILFLLLPSWHSSDSISITVHRIEKGKASPVLFMKRRVQKKFQKGAKTVKNGSSISPVNTGEIEKKAVLKQKLSVKKVSKKRVSQKVIKKPIKKKKITPVKKAVLKKVLPQKKATKKVVKEVEKALVAKKIPKKKEVEKVPPKQKIAKKSLEKTEVLSNKAVKKQDGKILEKNSKKQQKIVDEPGNFYVGNDYYEKGEKSQLALSRAVSRAWKPPRGLKKELRVQLQVHLKKDGVVKDVKLEKKSGVLAYDMSARAALWRAEYPREFWGKVINIVFGA